MKYIIRDYGKDFEKILYKHLMDCLERSLGNLAVIHTHSVSDLSSKTRIREEFYHVYVPQGIFSSELKNQLIQSLYSKLYDVAFSIIRVKLQNEFSKKFII